MLVAKGSLPVHLGTASAEEKLGLDQSRWQKEKTTATTMQLCITLKSMAVRHQPAVTGRSSW